MRPELLCDLGANDLARLYRTCEVSPIEVVSAHLTRCDRLNPELNAFLLMMNESAMDAAEASARLFRAGIDLGPLQGVPVSVKDLIRVKGTRTTAASRVLLEVPPDQYDASVVRRLRSAGAIILGKTNLHEFASGDPDPAGPFGWVQNPRRIGHHPGMSSSGAGSSIAAGLGVIAVGTDTGGSVRIPACFCGTVGLKPTTGRISMEGVIPLSASLDTLGFLGRRVSDVTAAWRACMVADAVSVEGVDSGASQYLAEAQLSVRGWRIGIFRGSRFELLQPAVADAFEDTLQHLRRLGCQLVDFESSDFEAMGELTLVITRAEAAAYHEQYRAREHLYGSNFLNERILPGRELKALDYLSTLSRRERFQHAWRELIRPFRLLLLPGSPIVAPSHSTGEIDLCGETIHYRRAAARFARPINGLGWPALTLPNGIDRQGLTTGVQIVGPPDGETDVLVLGEALERTLGLAEKLPIEPKRPTAQ